MKVLSLCASAEGGMAHVATWLHDERTRLHTAAGLIPVSRWPARLALPDHLLRQVALIEAHGWRAGWAGRALARSAGIPLVIVVHAFPPPGVRYWAWRALERRAFPAPLAYVAVSDPLAHWLQRRVAAPVEVVPLVPPSPTSSFVAARRALGVPLGDKIVGSIGRLSYEKGYDLLLRAWAQLQDRLNDRWVLSIVGDGPAAAHLKRLAQQLGITGSVRWHGSLPEAGRLVAAFDAYVQPSRREGLGIAALEAAAAAVPAVLTNRGGLRQVAADGAGAIIVEPDVKALVFGLVRLLSLSAVARRHFGSKFQQQTMKLRAGAATVRRLTQLYQSLAAGSGGWRS